MAAVLVGVGVLIAFLGVLLLAGVLLLITTLTGVLLLASVLLLVAFFLISFLLVSFLLVLRFVLALVAALVLIGLILIAALLTSVLLLVGALAFVLALAFILVLALARRVEPRLPRDDERVLVGVFADLRAVQVVRGQIVLVVVRLSTCVTTARRRGGAGLSRLDATDALVDFHAAPCRTPGGGTSWKHRTGRRYK